MDERRRAMGECNWMRSGDPPRRNVAIFGQADKLFDSGNRADWSAELAFKSWIFGTTNAEDKPAWNEIDVNAGRVEKRCTYENKDRMYVLFQDFNPLLAMTFSFISVEGP
jgi:hypothetical protein